MVRDHMFLRCVVIGFIALAATATAATLEGWPPLPALKVASAEPICASAAGQDIDIVVDYCFDPGALLPETWVELN